MKKDQIIAQYLDYLDEAERAPVWVYKFADAKQVSKEDFYGYFEDINQLEREIWSMQLNSTLQVLSDDPGFPGYTTREKLLAFYFTLFELLNENGHAFVLMLNRSLIPVVTPGTLKEFKQGFLKFVQELTNDGIKTGEIENRPLIVSYYRDALWFQCLFLLRFWKNDQSSGHTGTDEAVERSVNLMFDLLGYNPVDSAMGFTRFMYRHKKLFF